MMIRISEQRIKQMTMLVVQLSFGTDHKIVNILDQAQSSIKQIQIIWDPSKYHIAVDHLRS